MTKSLTRGRKRHARGGTTTVEFAFVAPIIFLMFIGAIELTRINFIRHAAMNACYEGARSAVVPGSLDSDAKTAATDLLRMLNVGNGANVTVSSNSSTVTVQVSVPLNQNSWGLTRFTGGINLTSSCSLSKESLK